MKVNLSHQHLLDEMANMETRLRGIWSAYSPLPDHLALYRQDWVEDFKQEKKGATQSEMQTALAKGWPSVVGDFHPHRRSGRSFAFLLETQNSAQRPGVLLELLPADHLLTAKEALQAKDLQLVDGRQSKECYADVFQVLAKQGGLVAGAWQDGSPQDRDTSAASLWAELQAKTPDVHWTLFFGDWHLAESHLPEALRQVGGKPIILHQSPEPLWRAGNSDWFDPILQWGEGHWAWLHTPPLVREASLLQQEDQPWDSAAQERTTDLCEEIMHCLAEALRLPTPSSIPVLHGPDEWAEFSSRLSLDMRSLWSPHKTPEQFIPLAGKPNSWMPSAPSFNLLVEAAAHTILAECPLGKRIDPRGKIMAAAFRHACKRLLNPFFAEAPTADLVELSKIPHLHPQARWIAMEAWGEALGCTWARSPRFHHGMIQRILKNQEQLFNWSDLRATISVA